VEAAAEGDDPRPTGHAPRELECAVDRLGPGIEEHDRVQRLRERRRQGGRQLADRRGEADRVDRADQPVDLGMDGRRDSWMGMSERVDSNAGCKIQVRPPVRVVQPMPFA
jgi:hypothetical protein